MISTVDDPANKESAVALRSHRIITATAVTPTHSHKPSVKATPLVREDMRTPLTMTKATWSCASSEYSTILTNSTSSTLSDWNVSECSDEPLLCAAAVAVDSPSDYTANELTREAVDLKFRSLSEYQKGQKGPSTETYMAGAKVPSATLEPRAAEISGKCPPAVACAEGEANSGRQGSYDVKISIGILLLMFIVTIVIVTALTSALIFVTLKVQKVDISTIVLASTDETALLAKESSYTLINSSVVVHNPEAVYSPAAEGAQLKALLRFNIKSVLCRLSRVLARRMGIFITRVTGIVKMAAQVV